MYKKNQRHLEANNMILKNNSSSKTEIHSEPYETCTPYKSKSTISTSEDPSKILTYYFSYINFILKTLTTLK